MGSKWSCSVKWEDASSPISIERDGEILKVDTDNQRVIYYIHDGGCTRCQHPNENCDTCKSWEAIEYTAVMGMYIPVKRRVGTRANKSLLSKRIIAAKNVSSIARQLGAVLGAFVKNEFPDLLKSDIVVGVPSTKAPSHAVTTAMGFCTATGHNGIREDLLVRTGNTKFHNLTISERWETAKKEFHPGRGLFPKGASVLIIDDILTEGATLDVCARHLISKGAKQVIGVVLARTI